MTSRLEPGDTAPAFTLPALAGVAVLPSTVEVLVNNQQRLSRQVPPGAFELQDVPVVTGAGDLNLILRSPGMAPAVNASPRSEITVEANEPGYTRTRCVATMLAGGHAPNALPQRADAQDTGHSHGHGGGAHADTKRRSGGGGSGGGSGGGGATGRESAKGRK